MSAATIAMIKNEYQSVTRAVIGIFAAVMEIFARVRLILNNIAKSSFSLDHFALTKFFSYIFY